MQDMVALRAQEKRLSHATITFLYLMPPGTCICQKGAGLHFQDAASLHEIPKLKKVHASILPELAPLTSMSSPLHSSCSCWERFPLILT